MCMWCLSGRSQLGIIVTTGAGAIRPRLTTKMPRVRHRNRDVQRAHIKFVSIPARTISKYRVGIQRFFKWQRIEKLPMPQSFDELDHQAGEYINFMYQDDRPLGWATDFVSGLKKNTRDAAAN